MKNILLSSALALTAYCLLASASAAAQDFPSAYARPAEIVDGIDVGSRVDVFAPAKAVAAQKCRAGAACGRRQGAPKPQTRGPGANMSRGFSNSGFRCQALRDHPAGPTVLSAVGLP
jgi:hypothetical protein